MSIAIEPRAYTVTEAAQLLGVYPGTVRRLIRAGRLRSVRFGEHGHHRIPASELDRLLAIPADDEE